MPSLDNVILQKKEGDNFDIITFLLVLALCGIGLASIYSATYQSQMHSFFYKQIITTGIGLAGMFVFAYLPKTILKNLTWVVYGISIIFLILVLYIGISSYGTKGWLPLFGFTLQPAELAKMGVIMIIALHLSGKSTTASNIRDIAISVVLLMLPAILIFLQPDHGTITVVFAIGLGMLFWAGLDGFFVFFVVSLPVIIVTALKGSVYFYIALTLASFFSFLFRKKIVITLAGIAVFFAVGFAAPAIYNNMMPHQKARIDTFLNPGNDPRGSGYNVIQSIMAVGSGGVTGKGYLQGTQTQLKYIPMQWTDFIFSVPTEEFGFIGGSLVIIIFAALIYRIIRIANRVNDRFYSLLAIGTASLFAYHGIINIGMAMGLMPVMGIPLPFMSYGGTSMVVNLSLTGLVINAYRQYSRESTSYS